MKDELLARLGTTVEHLWGVLLRQAPIHGAFSIVFDVVACVALYYAWRTLYKWDGYVEDKDILYALLGCVTAFVCVYVFYNLPMIAAAFFNPEYWALKQVLK